MAFLWRMLGYEEEGGEGSDAAAQPSPEREPTAEEIRERRLAKFATAAAAPPEGDSSAPGAGHTAEGDGNGGAAAASSDGGVRKESPQERPGRGGGAASAGVEAPAAAAPRAAPPAPPAASPVDPSKNLFASLVTPPTLPTATDRRTTEGETATEASPSPSPKKRATKLSAAERTARKRAREAHDTIASVFKFTIEDDRRRDVYDMVVISNVKTASGLMSVEDIDGLLASRLSSGSASHGSPLQYLSACFVRALAVSRRERGASHKAHAGGGAGTEAGTDGAKIAASAAAEVADAAQQAILTQAARAMIAPTAYPGSNPNSAAGLIDLWAVAHPSDYPAPQFVVRLIDDLAKQVDVNGLAAAVASFIHSKLSGMTIGSSYQPLFQALDGLLASKTFAEALVRCPHFLPPGSMRYSGRQLQSLTLLGVLISPSTYSAPVLNEHFSKPRQRTQQGVNESFQMLRRQNGAIWGTLKSIFLKLFKASEMTRDITLRWVATLLDGNLEKVKLQPNPMLVVDDGAMFNMIGTLLLLCEPFVDVEKEKGRGIDAKFLLSDTILFPDDEELLMKVSETHDPDGVEAGGAEEETDGDGSATDVPALFAEEGDSRGAGGAGGEGGATAGGSAPAPSPRPPRTYKESEFKFVTRLFFTTLRALHVGVVPFVAQYELNRRRLGQMQRMGPEHQAMADAEFSRMMLADVYVADPALLSLLLRFCALTSDWLTQVCSGDGELTVPLSMPPPREATLLREDFVSDITKLLAFVAEHFPDELSAVTPRGIEVITTFLTAFVASPTHVASAHVRAVFGSILYDIYVPTEAKPGGAGGSPSGSAEWGYVLQRHQIAKEHLPPALMELYGDVENTGFYEKSTHRFKIACTLNHLWTFPEHRDAFVTIARDSRRFTKFVNGVMNHTTNLLEDALDKLPTIREIQLQMQDTEGWARLSQDEQESKQESLRESEQSVSTDLLLANQTVDMLAVLTSHGDMQEAFMNDALVGRLATLINSVLSRLTGKKGITLKVDRPEQYHFQPREMLARICETVVHMSQREGFARAVATADFFDEKVFHKAGVVLRRLSMLTESEREEFERFQAEVKAAHGEADADDFDSDEEVPDEFMCCIGFDVMRDPVKLPSGNVVERRVIVQHLLNDPRDPFSREPLTEDMLVPEDELRARIEEWRASRG